MKLTILALLWLVAFALALVWGHVLSFMLGTAFTLAVWRVNKRKP